MNKSDIKKIRKRVRMIVCIVFLVASAIVLTLKIDLNTKLSWYGAVVGMLSLLVSWLGFWASTFAERAAAESLDLAKRTAHSQIHFLGTRFDQHLDLMEEHLSAEKFRNKPFELKLALSTPAYGIGALVRELTSADPPPNVSFLRYVSLLEGWVKIIDEVEDQSQTPQIEILIWPPDTGSYDFFPDLTKDHHKDMKSIVLVGFRRLADVLGALYKHHVHKRINLRVSLSNKNDNRLFLVNNGDTFSGFIACFSPLSHRSIEAWDWQLAAFSVYDRRGFNGLRDLFNCFPLLTDEHIESGSSLADVGLAAVHASQNCGIGIGSRADFGKLMSFDLTKFLVAPEKFLLDWFGDPANGIREELLQSCAKTFEGHGAVENNKIA